VKKIVYLAASTLVAMLILVPTALAQDAQFPGDTDPFSPETNAVVVTEAQLEQIAGQPLPSSQGPIIEPVPVTGQPSTSAPLPGTGGLEIDGSALAVVLSASILLLLGLGVLAYAVSGRR
jgi:hypothetical protein